jgi:hypothetical protein
MLVASRIVVVGESGAGTDEYVVFNQNAIPKIDAAFHRYTIADLYSIFNECVVTNIAVCAHDSAANDVRKGPDPRSLTDKRPIFDCSQRMNQWWMHDNGFHSMAPSSL